MLLQLFFLVQLLRVSVVVSSCSLENNFIWRDWESLLKSLNYEFLVGEVRRKADTSKQQEQYSWISNVLSLELNVPKINSKSEELVPSLVTDLEDSPPSSTTRVFQMKSDDIIVLFGCTPPPTTVEYFSFQHYFAYHTDRMADNGWRQVMGSLGPSVHPLNFNNYSKSSSSINSSSSGTTTAAAYDQPFIITMSSNITASEKLTQQYTAAGINVISMTVPTEWSTGNEVKFGIGEDNDLFSLSMRLVYSTHNIEPYQKLFEYVKSMPFKVYMVSKQPGTEDNQSLSSSDVVVQATENVEYRLNKTVNEASLKPSLFILYNTILGTLKGQRERWGSLVTISGEKIFPKAGAKDAVGTWASLWGFNCYGVSDDLSSYAILPKLKMEPSDELYVLGVRHETVGTSLVNQISVSTTTSGVTTVTGTEFDNSADGILAGTLAEIDSPFLYVLKFSLRCEDDDEAYHNTSSSSLSSLPCYSLLPRTSPSTSELDEAVLVQEIRFGHPVFNTKYPESEFSVVKPVYILTRPLKTLSSLQRYPPWRMDWITIATLNQECFADFMLLYIFLGVVGTAFVHYK